MCGMASVGIGSTKFKKRAFAVIMELWVTQVRNDGTEDSKWAAPELILFFSFFFLSLKSGGAAVKTRKKKQRKKKGLERVESRCANHQKD